MSRGSMPGSTPLTDEELDRLAAFLGRVSNEEGLSLEGLDGFFCALIAGPELVMPSECLPVLDDADERGVPGRKWARGFMRGVVMRRSSVAPSRLLRAE